MSRAPLCYVSGWHWQLGIRRRGVVEMSKEMSMGMSAVRALIASS